MKDNEIKDYWESRAMKYQDSLQATTEDFYMRQIELKNLSEKIKTIPCIKNVIDIGCGDGYTTIEIAKQFPDIIFIGYDFSSGMIELAKRKASRENISNVSFDVLDISKEGIPISANLIYTSRCLINLTSEESQLMAIKRIHTALNDNGHYLMVENFIDGNDDFNQLRRFYELPEIRVREHNLYFEQNKLLSAINELFSPINIENISSLYYLVSRIIYSKICQKNNQTPDYFDIHHLLASQLPILGNFGPVKLLTLKKTT